MTDKSIEQVHEIGNDACSRIQSPTRIRTPTHIRTLLIKGVLSRKDHEYLQSISRIGVQRRINQASKQHRNPC